MNNVSLRLQPSDNCSPVMILDNGVVLRNYDEVYSGTTTGGESVQVFSLGRPSDQVWMPERTFDLIVGGERQDLRRVLFHSSNPSIITGIETEGGLVYSFGGEHVEVSER